MSSVQQEIAGRLLEGWRMLDMTCPTDQCYQPVLQDKLGNRWCLKCKARIVTELEWNNEQQQREEEEEEEWVPPSEEEMQSFKEKSRVRDQVSELLGEKMLMGWTLMGEYCQDKVCGDIGVPLMKDKQKHMRCVWCDKHADTRAKEGTPKAPAQSPGVVVVGASTGNHSQRVRQSLTNKLEQYASILDDADPEQFERIEKIFYMIEKTKRLLEQFPEN
jgi:uncharacterized Zn finger protein (UPF0148 family)